MAAGSVYYPIFYKLSVVVTSSHNGQRRHPRAVAEREVGSTVIIIKQLLTLIKIRFSSSAAAAVLIRNLISDRVRKT